MGTLSLGKVDFDKAKKPDIVKTVDEAHKVAKALGLYFDKRPDQNLISNAMFKAQKGMEIEAVCDAKTVEVRVLVGDKTVQTLFELNLEGEDKLFHHLANKGKGLVTKEDVVKYMKAKATPKVDPRIAPLEKEIEGVKKQIAALQLDLGKKEAELQKVKAGK